MSRYMSYLRDGIGKSHNALWAELAGRYPMTTAKRVLQRRLAALGIAATQNRCRELLFQYGDTGEWHHTGKYGNCTDYYDVDLAIERIREMIQEAMS